MARLMVGLRGRAGVCTRTWGTGAGKGAASSSHVALSIVPTVNPLSYLDYYVNDRTTHVLLFDEDASHGNQGRADSNRRDCQL